MKRFHEFQLDSVNECLWRGSARLSLTPKAFQILNHLVQNAGNTITKDQFMEVIWPGVYVGEENLKVYVRELRSLLGDNATKPVYIETYRDRGYRFIAPVTDGTSLDSSATSQFFGRTEELRKLDLCFKQACRGNRQILFVTGEPGIGKTSLVDNFLLKLSGHQRVRLGLGQCIESYREQEAFYPVLEAFGRLLTDPMGKELSEILARKAPTWLVQFPGLVFEPKADSVHSEIVGAGRERMLREACEALETATAELPLILVLEDLHWSDHSTLDLIAALARRREAARLLLIATYRPVEIILANHPLRSLKMELCLHNNASEVRLEFLSGDAVTDYLTSRFSKSIAEQLALNVHQKTDGNPLFIVELVDHLINERLIKETGGEWILEADADEIRSIVPNSLIEIIQKQLHQLPVEEQDLLTAASVVGRSFSTAVLAETLNSNWIDIEERCDSLARRHLLLMRGGLLDLPNGQISGLFHFTHALHREVIYDHCRPTVRLDLHRRVGDAIESLWESHEHEIAGELIRHFLESREYENVVRYLRLQAENAEHRYVFQDAIVLLEQAMNYAIKLPASTRPMTSIELQSGLARLYDKLGDKMKAATIYGDVAREAIALKSWDVAVNSLISQSRQIVYSDPPGALRVVEHAMELCNLAGRTSELVAHAWSSFLKLSWQGWDPELKTKLEDCVSELHTAGDSAALAQFAAGLATTQVFIGDYEKALQTSAEALPILTLNGDSLSHFSVRWMRASALMKLGRLGEALEILQESLMLAERNLNTFDTAYGQMFTAELHLECLSPASAIRLCNEGVSQLSGSAIALQRGLIIGAMAYLETGDVDRSQKYLSRIKTIYDQSNILVSWYWKLLVHSAVSELSLATGDLGSARQEVELLRELAKSIPNPTFRARLRQISAKVYIAESKQPEAEQEIEGALGIVQNNNIPLVAWRVHETAATVYNDLGKSALVKQHIKNRDEILTNLASSLPENDPLRCSIMDRRAIQNYGHLPLRS